MVVTKHFATHGKKYRRRLIKYILNPDKTDNFKLVSAFGMSNYLDFPSYEEMVEMYNVNFTNNDKLYESRNDRQEKHQQNIHAHHLIQSFSPEDNLTPKEINRIGYETMMELTGGRFKFIVATHTDKDHTHNHILVNAIDSNSDKKLIWNYALERNLRMISDRISKMAGAKIIEKRYSYRDYQKYRQSSHKFELKQRLYFLMQQSKSFDDFLEKAVQLHVHIDFSQKHSRFMMTDRAMTKPIRGRQLSKRDLYDEEFFRTYFAKQEIESRLEFLLNRVNSLEELLTKAKELNLTIDLKQKNVTFILEENGKQISLSHKKISEKKLYDAAFFQNYFEDKELTYKTALPHHKLFIQYFGSKPLKGITARDCESFRLHIIENYFENYAKNLWSRFKACMGYAERLGYISSMPCKALDNPRGKHPDTPFWTYIEFQNFIKSFDLQDYEELQRFTTIWLYYMTGVRVSEGLSLWWEDVDFEHKFLKVHTTLEKDENGNWYRKDQTKTPAGERLIELDDVTISVLENWRKNQVANQDTDFIISRFGEPFCKSTICRIIKRKLKKLEYQ